MEEPQLLQVWKTKLDSIDLSCAYCDALLDGDRKYHVVVAGGWHLMPTCRPCYGKKEHQFGRSRPL